MEPLPKRSLHVVMLMVGLAVVVGAIPLMRRYLGRPVEVRQEGGRILRRDAGEPGADGWVRAASSTGRFAVDVPGKFSEFVQDSKDVDGAAAEVTGVRAVVGKAQFGAVASRRADGVAIPAERLGAIAEGLAKQGFGRQADPPEVGGAKGIEMSLPGRKLRVYVVNGAILQVMTDHAAEADEARFFGSLTVY